MKLVRNMLNEYRITCEMHNGLVLSMLFLVNPDNSDSPEKITVSGLLAIENKTSPEVFRLEKVKDCKVEFVKESKGIESKPVKKSVYNEFKK